MHKMWVVNTCRRHIPGSKPVPKSKYTDSNRGRSYSGILYRMVLELFYSDKMHRSSASLGQPTFVLNRSLDPSNPPGLLSVPSGSHLLLQLGNFGLGAGAARPLCRSGGRFGPALRCALSPCDFRRCLLLLLAIAGLDGGDSVVALGKRKVLVVLCRPPHEVCAGWPPAAAGGEEEEGGCSRMRAVPSE